jgi:pimeloyl-ACP methyl ester carboxylesterase
MTASAPPVVLLHGFATTFASTWVHNGWVDLFADVGRTVVPVDLLGHGTAPKPHDPQAYERMEEYVLEALPPEPVDAIGFSMGARTLLWLAGNHPDRFRRIIVAGVGANLFRADLDRGTKIRDAILGRPDPDSPESLYFATLAEAPGMDREALAACIARPGRPMSDEMYQRITMPTLVVLGDRDFAGPADPLLAALPRATFKGLRNVDHFATPKDFGFIDAAMRFLEAPDEPSVPTARAGGAI